jgi:outer membrane receptor for ferrienterochelin and colicins
MKKCNSILLFLSITGIVFAQKQINIQGRISDELSKSRLEYASIAILDQKSNRIIDGTLSDENGDFKLVCNSVDKVFIRVQYIGYNTLDTLFQIDHGNNLILQLGLRPTEQSLKEVIVSAEKGVAAIKMDRQSFNVQQLGNTVGGTAADILQRLPSVTINTEGKILMRGNAEFLVTVNGRFTSLTAADVLSQIPANIIENIEILTSPSASYDSDGKAGIINIITKKNIHQGWGFIWNNNLSSFNPQRYGSDFTLNHSSAKWNSFISANYRRYDIGGYRRGELRTLFQDTVTYSPSYGERPLAETVYGFRSGTTYIPDKSNVLNAGIFYGFRQNDRTANLNYSQYLSTQNLNNLYQTFDNSQLERIFYNQNLFIRTGKFFTTNLDYSHVFSNQSKLSMMVIYEHSVLGGPLTNQDSDPSNDSLLLKERSDETSPLNAWRLQSDYSLPLSKDLNFETGFQWKTVQHDGDFSFERLNSSKNIWEQDPEFNDELHLRQNVFAMYTQVSGKYKSISYTGGIRAENMYRHLRHLLGATPYDLRQFDFFPNAQLLWKISDKREFKLAYSKRIDRPTTKALSPFKNHRHSEAIWIGDPELLPELSHSVELGYTNKFEKGLLALTVYHRYTKNLNFRVNDIYNRITLLTIVTNAGNSNSTGLEFISDWQLKKWWRIYFSGNMYQFRISNIKNAETNSTESLNYNINGNMTFRLNNKLRMQYDANYISRTVTALGNDTDLFLSNISLKYKHNDKIAFDLLAQNIFNTNVQTITNHNSTFYSSIEYTKYDRIIQLSLSYRFNESIKTIKGTKTEYGEKDF